jgi:hypothetical protein
MGCVPPHFGIKVVITKCRIGDDELVVLFLTDGSGGGRRGVFDLIGVLSGLINLKFRLDFLFLFFSIFFLTLRILLDFDFDSPEVVLS